MSHLSTIIERVKRRAEFQDREPDPMFEQAVINLMEYLDAWDDYTAEELNEALVLYDKYRPICTGKQMPSHVKRLEEADEIRIELSAEYDKDE